MLMALIISYDANSLYFHFLWINISNSHSKICSRDHFIPLMESAKMNQTPIIWKYVLPISLPTQSDLHWPLAPKLGDDEMICHKISKIKILLVF